jgi:hypothetical protein
VALVERFRNDDALAAFAARSHPSADPCHSALQLPISDELMGAVPEAAAGIGCVKPITSTFSGFVGLNVRAG